MESVGDNPENPELPERAPYPLTAAAEVRVRPLDKASMDRTLSVARVLDIDWGVLAKCPSYCHLDVLRGLSALCALHSDPFTRFVRLSSRPNLSVQCHLLV